MLVSCDGSYPPPSNVAVDGSCWLTSHCAGDLVCAGTIGSSVCSDRSVGSACASARHCASDLVCDTTTSDGDAASDLCEAPVSVVAMPLGGGCLLTSQCTSGLVCAGTIGNSVCSNRSVGSACSSISHCTSGFYCDTTIKDGDAASDTCKAQQGLGGACSSAEQCASGLQCIADIVGSTRCSSGSISLGGALRIGSATQFGVAEDIPSGLAAIGDTLYMVGSTNNALYSLNSSSGVATRIGSATTFGVSAPGPSGLAAIDSTLYMVGSSALYTVNTGTGMATRVAPGVTRFGIIENGISVFTPTGVAAVGNTLYMTATILTTAFTTMSRLYRFDTDGSGNLDGTATRVGTTDSFGVGEASPAGLTAIGATLYMVGSSTDALYTVDATSSLATRVGSATTIRFGVSGEDVPSALAAIGSTLYMIGAETAALYALRYQ